MGCYGVTVCWSLLELIEHMQGVSYHITFVDTRIINLYMSTLHHQYWNLLLASLIV